MRLASSALLLLLANPVFADEIRLLVQHSPLAGLRYYALAWGLEIEVFID